MKKALLMFLLLTFTLVLAACGSDTENNNAVADNQSENNNGSEENNTQDNTEEESLLSKIQESGELLIGTEGTYPPFTFHEDGTGELTGFDVEIAREVAKRLGVEPVFKETQWDAMFAGLDSERFDMIANQVGIRPDRQEKYDFSYPYIRSAAVLVISKDNNEITSFDDIEGKLSAQSMTSNFADVAKSYGAEIEPVEGFNEAMQLLATNRVQLTINDSLSVLDYLNVKKDAPVKIVDREEEASESGLMFRKGNEELVEAVNQALQQMKEDGTYLEISKKWFGEDVSK
ncbi:amino acid ABC transporter substrate-binding protein [Bacillaceae bacterium S4-13-58]